MRIHQAIGHIPLECTAEKFGSCVICQKIASSEDYRRLFHPEPSGVALPAPNPQPRIEPAPVPDETPAPEASAEYVWPLAGDLVAALTAKIGAERAMKWISEKTGQPCNCPARRLKLNELDEKIRKWLGW